MKDGKNVVLCIDDDDDVIETVRTILESNGYLVEEAGTAEEGVKKYDEIKPDFVLVDLMMEEVDAGIAFTKALAERNNTAPVYMLSSVGDALAQNTDTTTMDVNGVLQKPVRAEKLLSIIKSKLG